MGLAFCFFLTLFEAEGRIKGDLVVVIDDPISSLDTTTKTHAFSLMRKMTKKCAQTIILTHNMSFMNMVKREFSSNQNAEKSCLLQLDCKGQTDKDRTTSLSAISPLFVNYDTEYHYLFSVVYAAHTNQISDLQFLLPNAIRKLLEMFTAYAEPAQINFAAAIGSSGITLKDNNIKSLERLIQIESHGTMVGMGSLPMLTVEEAIKASSAAMEFIRLRDKKHYKAMKKLCSI